MSVRTTLTLDDDVAASLRAEARRTGKPFKQIVNDLLRRAMTAPPPARRPFRVQARDLGLRSGLSLDDVQGLLDAIDGPATR